MYSLGTNNFFDRERASIFLIKLFRGTLGFYILYVNEDFIAFFKLYSRGSTTVREVLVIFLCCAHGSLIEIDNLGYSISERVYSFNLG